VAHREPVTETGAMLPRVRRTARVEAKGGSFGCDFEGTYTEVRAQHSPTLVLADGRTSRTTLKLRPRTRVETTSDLETRTGDMAGVSHVPCSSY